MPFDPNALASPRILDAQNMSGFKSVYNVTGGLTKRELIIMELLSALLVNGRKKQSGLTQVDLTPAELADVAITQADALIAKL